MTQKQLSIHLNNWFNLVKTNQNFWSANPVATVIKENLIKLGNFKNKKRGNPAKGRRIMLENKSQESC